MDVEINICWDSLLCSLNETISNELSRVTKGKYKHGKVIQSTAGDYRCGDIWVDGYPLFNYHRKLKVVVGELYGQCT